MYLQHVLQPSMTLTEHLVYGLYITVCSLDSVHYENIKVLLLAQQLNTRTFQTCTASDDRQMPEACLMTGNTAPVLASGNLRPS